MPSTAVLLLPGWSDLGGVEHRSALVAFAKALDSVSSSTSSSGSTVPTPTTVSAARSGAEAAGTPGLIVRIPLLDSEEEEGCTEEAAAAADDVHGGGAERKRTVLCAPPALIAVAEEVMGERAAHAMDHVHVVSDHDFACALMLRHKLLTARPTALIISYPDRDIPQCAAEVEAVDPTLSQMSNIQILSPDARCAMALPCDADSSAADEAQRVPEQEEEEEKEGDREGARSLVEAAFRAGIDASEAFDLVASARSFSEVLRLQPRHEGALFNMGSVAHMCGYPSVALHFIEQLLLVNPADTTAKAFLWSLATLEAVDLSPIYASVGLDSAAATASVRAMCVAVYTRLSAGGNDLNYKHRLAMLTGVDCSEADGGYLRDFYDYIAETFETKLVRHLGYRGPWILHRLVATQLWKYRHLHRDDTYTGSLNEEVQCDDVSGISISPIGSLRVLDLGCGSGLCGRVFARMCDGKPLDSYNTISVEGFISALSTCSVDEAMDGLEAAKRDLTAGLIRINTDAIVPVQALGARLPASSPAMVGVDISLRMVELASLPCNNYSLLACGHLIDALRSFNNVFYGNIDRSTASVDKFDVVLAADTFIYVGALGAVFREVARLLKRGGIFSFSTEHIAEDDNEVNNSVDSYIFDESGEVSGPTGSDRGYRLQEGSARFSHRASYINALCARCGLALIAREAHTLRSESSVPIPGMFYLITLL